MSRSAADLQSRIEQLLIQVYDLQKVVSLKDQTITQQQERIDHKTRECKEHFETIQKYRKNEETLFLKMEEQEETLKN